jgi:ankyrin repeat protein
MAHQKDSRTLEALLHVAADVLYPAGNAPAEPSVHMTGSGGDTALHVYLWRNDPWAIRQLLQHGANPNAVGDMAETPLHVAARSASAETIALLMEAGARETVTSEFAQTPAQLAESKGRLAVYREALRIVKTGLRRRRKA